MTRRLVLFACFDRFEMLDISGPACVFAQATALLGDRGGYDIRVAATRAGPIMTASGLEFSAAATFGTMRALVDTLIVPGGPFAAVEAAAPVLAPAIQRISPRARRVASVCTGAFVLSQAGLLDGRAAVTHWAYCDHLRRLNPRCRVEDNRIHVRDQHIWTSAGVSAGIDLALALVEEDHGANIALEVARWIVVYLRRPGGQNQFSAPLAAQVTERDDLHELVLWMSENIRADLSVGALARRTNMSERTFARVFVEQTKSTPAVFVERLRVDAARRDLETTKKSVKQIARACGFGSTETLHRAFKRAVGVTPRQYRARFATR